MTRKIRRKRNEVFKGQWVNGKWYTLMAIETRAGRKELTFEGIQGFADRISFQELKKLVGEWVNKELVSHGIVCEIRLYENRLEIWCTTREVLEGGFGEPLKIWDDPNFTCDLTQSFCDAVNATLAKKH